MELYLQDHKLGQGTNSSLSLLAKKRNCSRTLNKRYSVVPFKTGSKHTCVRQHLPHWHTSLVGHSLSKPQGGLLVTVMSIWLRSGQEYPWHMSVWCAITVTPQHSHSSLWVNYTVHTTPIHLALGYVIFKGYTFQWTHIQTQRGTTEA